MNSPVKEFRLIRQGDEVFLKFADSDSKTAVKVVRARPISTKSSEVAFVGPDKQELLLVESLDALDPASRAVAEEEIARRYIFPHITGVFAAKAVFGVRYWHVETDLGERHFALKNAAKNAVWLTDDHLVLTDTLGCRYEVPSLAALDPRSRAAIEGVL
jgi:hypothetical protein